MNMINFSDFVYDSIVYTKQWWFSENSIVGVRKRGRTNQSEDRVIKNVLAGHTVAVVTYCLTKMITTCLPMIGQFFDTIAASSNKGGYINQKKLKIKNLKLTAENCFESP